EVAVEISAAVYAATGDPRRTVLIVVVDRAIEPVRAGRHARRVVQTREDGAVPVDSETGRTGARQRGRDPARRQLVEDRVDCSLGRVVSRGARLVVEPGRASEREGAAARARVRVIGDAPIALPLVLLRARIAG